MDSRLDNIHSLVTRTDGAAAGASSVVTKQYIEDLLKSQPYLLQLADEYIAKAAAQQAAVQEAQAAAEQKAQAAYERGLAIGRKENLSTYPKRGVAPAPPKVCETAASSLDTTKPANRSKKAKYDKEILPQELYENAFVHVKTYFHFVKGCATAIHDESSPNRAAMACFAVGNDSFDTWCPAENASGGSKEMKRSLALCRAFDKQLCSDPKIDVRHQIPVSPPVQPVKHQSVDIGFFWQPENNPKPRLFALLEYKPGARQFETFDSQTCAYATDLMSFINSPNIVIQASGDTLETIGFRVFGIVPANLTNDTAEDLKSASKHRKAILFEGWGHAAFAAITNGLLCCAAEFKPGDPNVDEWDDNIKVSSVASIHKNGEQRSDFVKAFDYRLRSDIPKNNRRQVNINLVRQFIDSDAKCFCLGEDLNVVVVRFYEQNKGTHEWYSDFPVRKLRQILMALAKVHEMGYVHGDIRLFNLLLHVGKIVDFDHARMQGTFYADSILSLEHDGKRAEAVQEAITNNGLSLLRMEFDHDWESMKHVLDKLQPTSNSPREFIEWWNETVPASGYESVIALEAKLEQWCGDDECRLECNEQIKSYLRDGGDRRDATDSPKKQKE
mmetsp:Transcript_1855/g.3846  ORF Transcript_1855/g.3846 Transcript_1855/m.3846 type:complete len:614 (-) Transcript_1855:42-1883(-)